MQTIRVKPVEIIGRCRAGLTPEDEFRIEGPRLVNPQRSNLCVFALGQFAPVVAQLQRGKRFFAHVACTNCTGLERENRAVFLLGHADKWELCQALPEYRRLCRDHGEPETARHLRAEAIQHQNRGEYAEAVRKMQAALTELQPSVLPSPWPGEGPEEGVESPWPEEGVIK